MTRGVEGWFTLAARLVLGLVFLWFGLHELRQPHLWTGYVPIVAATSTPAIWAVLAHGAILFVLAIALLVGIAPRTAALVGALLLLEIVISLAVQGINDIVVRDLGILGLALAVAATPQQRLVLRG